MNYEINNIRKIRTSLLNIIKDLSLDQLNMVPTNFNNNIIWNLAHLISAQQGICYKRSEKNIHISEDFYNAYKPGSKPEKPLTEIEIEEVKKLLFTSLDLLENDVDNNVFEGYKTWNSRYDVEIKNINDAISFLQFHEGLHMGYIMALKKIVTE